MFIFHNCLSNSNHCDIYYHPIVNFSKEFFVTEFQVILTNIYHIDWCLFLLKCCYVATFSKLEHFFLEGILRLRKLTRLRNSETLQDAPVLPQGGVSHRQLGWEDTDGSACKMSRTLQGYRFGESFLMLYDALLIQLPLSHYKIFL